jgi:hypothetical protein
MKKTIRLNETELTKLIKKIVKEQTIQSCPEVKVTKPIVDKHIPLLKSDVKFYIDDLDRELRDVDDKYINIIKDEVNKQSALIEKINLNTMYALYGIIPTYDRKNDVMMLLNSLYNVLINKIEGNFLYKNILRATIDKSNINSTKNELKSVLDGIYRVVNKATYQPGKSVRFKIRDSFPNKCKQGQPNIKIYDTAVIDTDTKQIRQQQLTKLYQVLDSYV